MDQPPSSRDRRKFPRIPREVSIEVNKIEYPLPEVTGEGGIGKNIGKAGICFMVSSPYEPKTLLSLKIHLKGWQQHKKNVSSIVDPSAATAPLTAIAEVVWLKKLPGSPGYEVGVKFLDIYQDDYIALEKHLDNILLEIANLR